MVDAIHPTADLGRRIDDAVRRLLKQDPAAWKRQIGWQMMLKSSLAGVVERISTELVTDEWSAWMEDAPIGTTLRIRLPLQYTADAS